MTPQQKENLEEMLYSGDMNDVELAMALLRQHAPAKTADWQTLLWQHAVLRTAQLKVRGRTMYIGRKAGLQTNWSVYQNLIALAGSVDHMIAKRTWETGEFNHNMHIDYWVELFKGLSEKQQLKFNETIINDDEKDNLSEH